MILLENFIKIKMSLKNKLTRPNRVLRSIYWFLLNSIITTIETEIGKFPLIGEIILRKKKNRLRLRKND